MTTTTRPAPPRRAVRVVGVDPAARRDSYALAVIDAELVQTPGGRGAVIGEALFISAARNVPYEFHAALALELLTEQDAELPLAYPLGLAFDAGGAGSSPAAQLGKVLTGNLRDIGIRRSYVSYAGINLVGGLSVNEDERQAWMVNASRSIVVGGLVLAIRAGDLDLTGLARSCPDEVEVLAKEMDDFRATPDNTGREKFEHKPGGHDDLLLALGLAWFQACRLLGSPASGGTRVHRPDGRAAVSNAHPGLTFGRATS